jgi:hypothetical protein
MNTKLTLNLNKALLKVQKITQKTIKISLSKLIENYLNSLITKEKKEIEISPLVEFNRCNSAQSDKSSDDDYYEYLSKKYS